MLRVYLGMQWKDWLSSPNRPRLQCPRFIAGQITTTEAVSKHNTDIVAIIYLVVTSKYYTDIAAIDPTQILTLAPKNNTNPHTNTNRCHIVVSLSLTQALTRNQILILTVTLVVTQTLTLFLVLTQWP